MKHTLLAALITASTFGLNANAALLTTTDSTYGAFDNSSGTRTLNIGTHGLISDVNITLDFAKCDDPATTANDLGCIGTGSAFLGEIVFRLTSATGTTVNLINEGTYIGSAGSRITLTLDDEAATTVGGSSLVAGTFDPVSALSAFDGEDAFGDWTLFIEDTVGADPLMYFSSTLNVTTRDQQVPEPSVLALLGLGLLGLAASRRKA